VTRNWYRCPHCKIERTDVEELEMGIVGGVVDIGYLDDCPNCGSEAAPEKAGTWNP
jgi:rubredoxin